MQCIQPDHWIAVLPLVIGAADGTYLEYVYIGAGATSTSWTVNMPVTPGDYEFRLFEDGVYTRLATSSTVVVNPKGHQANA